MPESYFKDISVPGSVSWGVLLKEGSWYWGESAHISNGKNGKILQLVLYGYFPILSQLSWIMGTVAGANQLGTMYHGQITPNSMTLPWQSPSLSVFVFFMPVSMGKLSSVNFQVEHLSLCRRATLFWRAMRHEVWHDFSIVLFPIGNVQQLYFMQTMISCYP